MPTFSSVALGLPFEVEVFSFSFVSGLYKMLGSFEIITLFLKVLDCMPNWVP